MRLAVISDVHGNVVALDAVLRDLKQRAPDAIVNLGDLVTVPLWPRETLEMLETLSAPTVRGNHDRWLAERSIEHMSASMRFTYHALTDEQRTTLGALPKTLAIDDAVLAGHGTPSSDVEYLLEDTVDGRLALGPSGARRSATSRADGDAGLMRSQPPSTHGMRPR